MTLEQDDVSDLLPVATTPPQQAAENIAIAQHFDTTPELGKELSDTLKPRMENEKINPIVPKVVADRMTQSTEHASVLKQDIGVWDKIAKQFDFAMDTVLDKAGIKVGFGGQILPPESLTGPMNQVNFTIDTIKGRMDSRELFNLNYKKITEGLTDEEQFRLDEGNLKLKEVNLREDYGYDFKEAAAGEVVSTFFDMGHGALQNYKYVLGGTAIGAGAGFAGFAAGPLGTLTTGAGAIAGATAGFTVAQAVDTYKQSTGQVYNDLTYIMKDGPKTEDERRKIAKGAGVVMAALDSVSTVFLATKWAKNVLSPSKLLRHAMTPEGSKWLRVIKDLVQSGVAEGGTEGLQQFVQQIANNVGKTWDGDETKFLEGLSDAALKVVPQPRRFDGKIEATPELKELGEATALGVLAAPIFTATGQVGGHVLQKIVDTRRTKAYNDMVNTVEAKRVIGEPLTKKEQQFVEVKKLEDAMLDHAFEGDTPLRRESFKVLEDVAKKEGVDLEAKPAKEDPLLAQLNQRTTPLTNVNEPALDRSTRSIHLEMALNQIIQETNNTETEKYLPNEIDIIVEELAKERGLKEIWVPSEEFTKWADSQKKAQAAAKILDPTQIAAGQMNSPLRFTVAQFTRLAREFPDITALATREPEDPSVKGHIDRLNKRKESHEKLKAEMPQVKGFDIPYDFEPKADFDVPAMLTIILNDIDDQRASLLGHNESKQVLELADKALKEAKKKDPSRTAEESVKADAKAKKLQAIVDRLDARVKKMETLNDGRIRNEDIQDNPEFLEQDTVTPQMAETMPAKELAEMDEAVLKARMRVLNAANEEIQLGMDQVIELEKQRLLFNEETKRIAEAESDENITIVEDFLNNRRQFGDLTDFQEEQARKGNPIHVINPESILSGYHGVALWEKWKDHPKLKERKVFNRKGVTIDAAMSVFGVTDPDKLLQILAESPTIDEYIVKEKEFRERQIAREAKENTQFDESEFAKSLDDYTKAHLKQSVFFRNEFWSTFKKQIIKTAKAFPKLDELGIRAKFIVNATKIKDLHANQWKVAERKSNANAMKALLNTDFEVWGRERTNAAQSVQLWKQTQIEIGKVNKALEWIAGLPRFEKMLDRAGMLDAMNEILDVYNFDPSKKNQSKADAFNKLAQQLLDDGQGDYRIDPLVAKEMSDKVSVNDLTVEELMYIYGKMRSIVNEARAWNKVINEYEAEVKTIETKMIADVATRAIKEHPAFDQKHMNMSVTTKGAYDSVVNWTLGAEASIMNIKATVDFLDQGKLGGFFGQMFWDPIEGTGKFEGKYGLRARYKLQGEIRRRHKAAIDKYGKQEYKDLGRIAVQVPEFKNFSKLSNGNLLKIDLLMIAANTGSESNWLRVENYVDDNKNPISRDVMKQVLERELTKKDFELLQEGIWDIYADLKPMIAETHKKLTGLDLKFVEAQAFTVHGKTFKGGYFPIKLHRDSSVAVQNELDRIVGTDSDPMKPSFNNHPAFDGIVWSPFTKERTGTAFAIDLDNNDFNRGFDEVAHAVTMAIPVKDTMKLLTDPNIAAHLKGVLGAPKFKAMVDSYAGLTNSVGAQNALQYAELTKMASSVKGYLGGTYLVGQIAGNVKTVAINMLTVPKLLQKMGAVQGGKHLTNAALRISHALIKGGPEVGETWNAIMELANEIDNSLLARANDLEDFSATTFENLLPKKRWSNRKLYHQIKGLQEGTIHFLMDGILGRQDLMFKLVTSIGGYNQFMAGDAPNMPMNKVMAMTPEERHQAAKAYANSLSASTTMRGRPSDKAPIQKMADTKEFALVWNEVRSSINNNVLDSKLVFYDAKKFLKKLDEKKYEEAGQAFWDAGTRGLRMIIMSYIASEMITALARGTNILDPEEDEEKPFELADIKEIPNWFFKKFTVEEGDEVDLTGNETIDKGLTLAQGAVGGAWELTTGVFTNNLPILRTMAYGEKTGKGLTTPLLSALEVLIKGPKVVAQELGDGLNMIEMFEDTSPKDRRHLLQFLNLAVGPIPVAGTIQLYDYIVNKEEEEIDNANNFVSLEPTVKAIDHFVEKYDESEEAQFERDLKNSEKSELQGVVDQVKEIKEKMVPKPVKKPEVEE